MIHEMYTIYIIIADFWRKMYIFNTSFYANVFIRCANLLGLFLCLLLPVFFLQKTFTYFSCCAGFADYLVYINTIYD